MADGDDERSSPSDEEGTVTEPTDGEEPEPTPQPAALRQQQRYVAIGGSVVAGFAVTVSLLQRFPGYAPVGILAGLVSAVVVYRLAARSVFPGDSEDVE